MTEATATVPTITQPHVTAEIGMVEAAQRGDLIAWERLVRRYQEDVYRVAYLIVRDTQLAEQATQSTFVRAYRALPSFEQSLGLLPWFFRIAAGEARQQRRESGRTTRSSRPIERSTGPHFPATAVHGLAQAASFTPQERQVVAEAFDRLGEEDRLVIASRYLFGLTKADAANALALPSNVVNEHLHTAIERLRKRMQVSDMSFESHPGSVTGLDDDQLATAAVSLVIAELEWTPDVAPAVMDRISRDAVAYPEHFDRRPGPGSSSARPVEGRSAKRTVGRMAVFVVIAIVLAALVVVVVSANGAEAADVSDLRIELEEVASGYEGPVLVTNAGDGSGDLYVVEQSGRIWPLTSEGSPAEPFLDLSGAVVTGFEQGLLGLVFHPAYEDNGRFFVNYTRRGDGATVVSEFTAADGTVDPASEREIIVISQPFGNHNAGDLWFDASGMLLVPTGDGGSGGDPQGNGQNPDSLLGKMLRLDVDGGDPYAIPADNGFAATDAHRPEIHAKGLRNPWRISVDPVGGHIYIGDVGQSAFEEVSVMVDGAGGQSFGWNEVEGPQCFVRDCDQAAHVPPAAWYGRDGGSCSIVGGHVYRGSAQPELDGVYLFGDFCSGTIWGADADALVAGAADPVPIGAMRGTLVSFGADEAGELYVVDQGGSILRVVTEAA